MPKAGPGSGPEGDRASTPPEAAASAIESTRRKELAGFLRARRGALTPEVAKLPTGKRRRTPGLRREEIAQLADVGVTWYTWLEQGRNIHVSRETLERIAHALRLTPSDKQYLFDLVNLTRESVTNKVDHPVQAVLDALAFPAMLANARLDVLAFNRLLDALYQMDANEGRFARNLIWRGFMDPVRRALYAEWSEPMTALVGFLRSQYTSRMEDTSFEDLITELSRSSPEFSRMWRGRATEKLSLVYDLRLSASRLGILSFHSTRFILPIGLAICSSYWCQPMRGPRQSWRRSGVAWGHRPGKNRDVPSPEAAVAERIASRLQGSNGSPSDHRRQPGGGCAKDAFRRNGSAVSRSHPSPAPYPLPPWRSIPSASSPARSLYRTLNTLAGVELARSN